MQVFPSPLKPDLQAQVNDPAVFVQTAFLSQLFNDDFEHSSISRRKNLIEFEILTLFPMGSGSATYVKPFFAQNVWLRLNLWIYNKSGLKLQKNPNQLCMN